MWAALVEQRLRLGSGLVLFMFVATHLLNHALGIASLTAAETGRDLFLAVWRTPVGTLLLYGAFLTHIALVLWALYQRRHLRLPRWEVVRLALGLAMPFLLIPHIVGTRLLNAVYGVDDTYARIVEQLWSHAESGLTQIVLLVIAWVHGCMGIHFWLRLRPWYARVRPILFALAVLTPVLAVVGYVDMGKRIDELLAAGVPLVQITGPEDPIYLEAQMLWQTLAIGVFAGLVGLVFLARPIRTLWEHRHGVVHLTYPNGRRVAIAPGTSILEASRAAGIPHASLCGGRGRCSTCRTRIGRGFDRLPPPSEAEARVLRRVGAAPNVRLACQLRPTIDLEVTPLLPPTATPADGFLRPSYSQGQEQEIAILFADLRGFTQFSEHRLPYDVVFVLNRYFAATGDAIGRTGGHLDKFIGDGIMALYGLDRGPRRGCQDALRGAAAIARALDELNRALANDLTEPLRLGIGLHVGRVIVGELGYGAVKSLTAIGDAVNTASRLEGLTKEYGCQFVVSEDVAVQAGVDLSTFPLHEVAIRGRSTPLRIRALARADEVLPTLDAARLSAAAPAPVAGG